MEFQAPGTASAQREPVFSTYGFAGSGLCGGLSVGELGTSIQARNGLKNSETRTLKPVLIPALLKPNAGVLTPRPAACECSRYLRPHQNLPFWSLYTAACHWGVVCLLQHKLTERRVRQHTCLVLQQNWHGVHSYPTQHASL